MSSQCVLNTESSTMTIFSSQLKTLFSLFFSFLVIICNFFSQCTSGPSVSNIFKIITTRHHKISDVNVRYCSSVYIRLLTDTAVSDGVDELWWYTTDAGFK